jgi:hypothetical protein
MQSKKETFIVDLEASDATTTCPRSFALYEEYSQKNIAETIRTRRVNFGTADLEERRAMTTEVENEVERFRLWLEKTKGLQPDNAHYYATSLKSLLLGLPVGVQVAQLFDSILNAHTRQ